MKAAVLFGGFPMLRIIFGIFIVLHGLVHLLYLGQSQRIFELQSGMDWPDRSWAFSAVLGDGTTRVLANVLLAAAALVFAVGGIGIITDQAWSRPIVVAAAAFSAVIFLLLWNGKCQQLDDNGGVGLLINLVILALLLIVQWPNF
jgi:uncharacterized membrane protein YphA (DoxX/SURF4 family)